MFDLIGAQGMNVVLRKFIVFNLKKEKKNLSGRGRKLEEFIIKKTQNCLFHAQASTFFLNYSKKNLEKLL